MNAATYEEAHDRMMETNRAIRAGCCLKTLVAMGYSATDALLLHVNGGFSRQIMHKNNRIIKQLRRKKK